MMPIEAVEEAAPVPPGMSIRRRPWSATICAPPPGWCRPASCLRPNRVSTVAATVLGSFAAVFGIFGLRTVLRHRTSLEMSDTELRASGALRRRISWAELDRMKLSYYSTRRDRRSGWMQLELSAGAPESGSTAGSPASIGWCCARPRSQRRAVSS